MRYLAALSLATALVQLGTTAHAQLLPTDAINIPLDTRVARIQGEWNNGGATGGTTWYKFDAPISGKIYSQVMGLGFWTWVGVIDDKGALVSEMGTSTSYVGSGTSTNTDNYDVVGGTTYYVAVIGNGALSVRPQAPYDFFYIQVFTANKISDSFAERTPIGGRKFSISGSLAALTAETDEPQHNTESALAARKTGWMTYTSATRSTIKLNAESKIALPLLAVYRGDALASLTRVAQSTGKGASGGVLSSTLSFVAEAGVPYAIAIDAGGVRAGPFTLAVESATVAPGFLSSPKTITVFNGDPATFTATAATTGEPSYQWQHLPLGAKTWVNVSDSTEAAPTIFSGATTNTLNLSGTTLAMNGDKFRLRVTDSVSTTFSSAATLRVSEFQAVQAEVLGSVNFTDIGLSDALPDPTNDGVYFATGLPKGLTIDPETGVISGTVTDKAGVYVITYGSTNGKKRNPQQFPMVINVIPLSAYFTGAFESLPFNGDAQPRPAGKIRLTVAASGAFTGSFFALDESKTYAFKGKLALDQAIRSAAPEGDLPVVISRGRNLSPLHLTFSLVEPQAGLDGHTTFNAYLRVADGPFVGDTYSGFQLGTFSAAALAAWNGTYTARLTTDDNLGATPDASLPRGSGYATATIAPNTGALALRGRLAEGTAFTANLPSSGDARYLLAQRIHSGVGGSLSGQLALSPRWGDEAQYHIPDFGERLYWVKTPDKNYPQGFGPLSIRFLMAPWTNPGADFVKRFSLSSATGAFTLNLNSAAFVNAPGNSYNLPIDLSLGATGQVSLLSSDGTTPPANLSKFKTSINANTGLVTGNFTLIEPAAVPPAKKPASRTISFTGVMFQDDDIFTNDVIAEGYFLVPSLVKGMPVSSGLFEFRAGPPDSPLAEDPIGLPATTPQP